ncbi:MAG: family 10 glycosylhydrolase, partial [Planctomycetes bacterium]|nr:family 10 glycosylhydrolase [Planctomycetota bacterium]
MSDKAKPGRIEKRRGLKLFHAAIRRLFKVAPRFDEDNASSDLKAAVQWKAYRLHLLQPGVPHRLVLTIPTQFQQHVGISILEPNAAGQLMPVGIDSGISGNGLTESATATGNFQTERQSVLHKILFWPKVTNPVLMLHDIGTGEPFDVTEVSLYEIKTNRKDAVKKTLQRETSRRLVGPYMHKPLLPENFGATETLDEAGGRSLDDWVTFLTASQRLCDYLHFMNYNSLMIGVFADGSTIYPSRLLQPSPRYDTGIYFSTGQDPLRKDVLELLYRMFDREQLVLVPELQFSTPLPALERQLDGEKQDTNGIELIGRDGRSWRQSRGTQRGLASYYNPLNPIVQKAILDVVEELVDRYRHHESFQGLAVELSCWGYLQFPGLEWGYDDETIERFEQKTGIRIPNVPDDQKYHKRYEYLTSTVRREWIRWRCEELARFHRQLAKVVTDANPTAKFILAGHRLLREENTDKMFSRTIYRNQKYSDLLRQNGLDFRHYLDAERFVILRPWMPEDRDRISQNNLTQPVNQSLNFQEAFGSRQQGTLFFHPPRECRIPEFDQISPWQPAYTWLAAQVSPDGEANRKRYALALASHDAQMLFDGGWMIPLGQEHQTQKVRDVISRLPAIPFYENQIQKQPLTLRIAHSRNKTWMYVVNEFDGEIDVRLRLSCPKSTPVRVLEENRQISFDNHPDGGSSVSIHLQPFGIWACEVNAASVHVRDVQTQLSVAALAKLEKEIRFLDRKLLEVQRMKLSSKTDLKNPGFELPSNTRSKIPGWNLTVRNASLWTLDKQNPRSGQTSL